MTARLGVALVAGLIAAGLVFAIVAITTGGGSVDPIQTDQISRVSDCWLEGCR